MTYTICTWYIHNLCMTYTELDMHCTQPDNYEAQVIEVHKAKTGYTPAQAESEFLSLVKDCPRYGEHLFLATVRMFVCSIYEKYLCWNAWASLWNCDWPAGTCPQALCDIPVARYARMDACQSRGLLNTDLQYNTL